MEYEALVQTVTDAESSYIDYLEQCLKAEQQSRQQRTRSVLLNMAGFPAVKQLYAYDIKFAVGAPKKQIEALASLSFIRRNENIVLLGCGENPRSHCIRISGSTGLITRFITAADLNNFNFFYYNIFTMDFIDMLVTSKSAMLASTFVMLFTVVPASGQSNPAKDPASESVVNQLIEREKLKADRNVESPIIKDIKQKYISTQADILILQTPEHLYEAQMIGRLQNPSKEFPITLNKDFVIIEPKISADVLDDWFDRHNGHSDKALGEEIAQARSSNCNEAAYNWSEYVYKIDYYYLPKVNGDINRLPEVLKTKDREVFRAAVEAYDTFCLNRLDDVPPEFEKFEYKNVVAIVHYKGVPLCGALRVRSDTFVTARHCFFHKRGFGGLKIEENQGDVSISILLEPNTNFTVRKIFGTRSFDVKTPREFSDLEDYLFLRTEPIKISMPPISMKIPKVSERLFLIGYFRFHQSSWIFGLNSGKGNQSEWFQGIRWSKAPLCRIGPIKDGCLSHFCQTDRRFSGSGMLARDSKGGLSYFGIHIAGMNKEKGSCHVDTESAVGNMGIQIDLPDEEPMTSLIISSES